MKRYVFILTTIFFITGCAMPVGYSKFTMTNPTDNKSVKDDTVRYIDDKIDVIFTILKDSMFAGVEEDGFSQYWQYRSIVFTLINKTNDVVTVDWNKVSFKDYMGNSGAIMHQGIKYNECASIKAPITIPPKGKLADVITPCNAIKFVVAGSMSRWEVSMLPSARKMPKAQFGIFMPLQIGDKTINYNFEFQAEADTNKK